MIIMKKIVVNVSEELNEKLLTVQVEMDGLKQ